MDIHIDPHWISSVIGFVLIALLCTAWARFFCRLDTFLAVLCLSLTIMVGAQGELSQGRLLATGIIGVAVTVVLAIAFGGIRYSLRRNRALRRSLGRRQGNPGNRALRFAERDDEPAMARRGRLQDDYYERRTVPVPAPAEREVPLDTDEMYEDEYEEQEVRTRAPQRHSAQSRSRGGYVVKSHPAGKPSSARGAGLQQQRQQQRRRA